MKTLIDWAMPKFSLIGVFLDKPMVILIVAPAVAAANTVVVSFESMAWILSAMFLADLVTGLLASYFTWRKSDHKDRWFFGKGEGFSSDKFKKMFFKAIAYGGAALMLIQFQTVLHLRNFKYESLSDAEFEWATIAIVIACLIEGFSIFHENLPKCGFNLWHTIKKIIGFYKEVKADIP